MSEVGAMVELAIEALEDEAFRRGGCVPNEVVLRVCERHKLDVAQVALVRQRLESHEIEIEGSEEGDVGRDQPPAEGEPSATEVTSLVDTYLRETRRFDLLTREEEIALMRRIRAGEEATRLLQQETPSIDGTGQLRALVQDGKRARRRFIESNVRLVAHMVRKLNRLQHMPTEDLIQEGNIGLMKAIEKWDHQRGLKFATYATWWIFQGVTRALADKSRLVRVPVHMQERASKLRKLERALTRFGAGRPPTVAQLAEHLGWPEERVEFLLNMNQRSVSLDAPVSGSDELTRGEALEDESARSPEEHAAAGELSRDLKQAILGLKEREALVLERRFRNEETLEQIGNDLEVTRERIRQIEAKALKRLRHPSKSKALSEHLEQDDAGLSEDDEGETS